MDDHTASEEVLQPPAAVVHEDWDEAQEKWERGQEEANYPHQRPTWAQRLVDARLANPDPHDAHPGRLPGGRPEGGEVAHVPREKRHGADRQQNLVDLLGVFRTVSPSPTTTPTSDPVPVTIAASMAKAIARVTSPA